MASVDAWLPDASDPESLPEPPELDDLPPSLPAGLLPVVPPHAKIAAKTASMPNLGYVPFIAGAPLAKAMP